MASETGHGKNAANANTLNTYLSGYGNKYAPSNPKIKLAALQQLFTDIQVSIADCGNCKNAHDLEVGIRRNVFIPMKPYCTRIVKAFRTSDILPQAVATAESINKKIQPPKGDDKKPSDDPNADPDEKSISRSQQSIDNLILHYDELVDLAKQQPNYNPSEADLTTAAMEAYAVKLKAADNAVKAKYIKWTEAMDRRNKLLYTVEVGLVDRTVVVKEYIEQVYGMGSAQAKQCRALKFKRY